MQKRCGRPDCRRSFRQSKYNNIYCCSQCRKFGVDSHSEKCQQRHDNQWTREELGLQESRPETGTGASSINRPDPAPNALQQDSGPAQIHSQQPHHTSPSTIPFSFLCPITHEVMTRPVQAADGHSYEEAAIKQWLQCDAKATPPMTGLELEHVILTPNSAPLKSIEEWTEHGWCPERGRKVSNISARA